MISMSDLQPLKGDDEGDAKPSAATVAPASLRSKWFRQLYLKPADHNQKAQQISRGVLLLGGVPARGLEIVQNPLKDQSAL